MTEFGLFDIAEPVLRDLRLDVVADQIDLNYNDLLKPATIQEVDGISELLTVPRNYLTRASKRARVRWRPSAPKRNLSRTLWSPASATPATWLRTTSTSSSETSRPRAGPPTSPAFRRPYSLRSRPSNPASTKTSKIDAPTGGKAAKDTDARREVARRRSTQGGQGHRQGAGRSAARSPTRQPLLGRPPETRRTRRTRSRQPTTTPRRRQPRRVMTPARSQTTSQTTTTPARTESGSARLTPQHPRRRRHTEDEEHHHRIGADAGSAEDDVVAGTAEAKPATVASQVHSGMAASRGDDVHCRPTHTRAALSRPLISALIGNGTGPM